MNWKRSSAEQFISIWGVFSLSLVTVSSAPQLIDGISYHKVALALVLMSVILPFILYRLVFREKRYILLLFLLIIISLGASAFLDGQNNYRDSFGAPGRSNGLISSINFLYFMLFGFFLASTSKVNYLVKGLSIISPLVCVSIICSTELSLFQDSFLAAWNFNNLSFQENSNLIAPLIAMGLINAIQQIAAKQSFMNLILLLPQLYLLLKLSLLQSLFAVAAGLIIFWIIQKNLSFQARWIPMVISLLYLIGVWITKSQNFLQDSSLIERRKILTIFGDLRGELTLLPSNIDALSDFTGGYNSSQILDDFHNVFLQITFSYGILLGVSFFILSILPFWCLTIKSNVRNAILPIYTTFFTSLTVGIVSPNYIYFGAAFIGVAIGARKIQWNPTSTKFGSRELIGSMLIVAVVLLPLSTQLKDYSLRKEISNLTQLGSLSSANLGSLSAGVDELPDAGYRYLVARNFYIVGECARGDAILEAMRETNGLEVRISRLRVLAQNCDTIAVNPEKR